MANVDNLKVGTRLLDHRTRSDGRIIVLTNKINPQGLDIGPFWQVENEETKRQTLIREDTFAGSRWSNLTTPEEETDSGSES